MSVRRATPTERGWVNAARGTGGLVGILMLAVGIPIALIAWVGWPLPSEMPTADEVSTALSTADISDAFLIKTLAIVCWFVWVELMTSLIVEAVAHARGKEAGRVPMGGGMQRTAARLVATVALLGALTTAKGAPEAAELVLKPLTSGSPSADMMVHEEDEKGGQAESSVAAQQSEKERLPVYEVEPRDTLWGIAESHLHDPFRWPEIFEMNKGKVQQDGRMLTDPDLIQPGWKLDMPADAVGLGDPDAAESDTSPEDSGPDVNDEPDPEPEPDDGGDGGGSGAEAAGGGMTVLDERGGARKVEYAAPDEGMVLLPGDATGGQSESVAPGFGIQGFELEDELAAPGSQGSFGAYAEPTDDRQG